MPKHHVARRRKLAQMAAETAAYFDASNAQLCICGVTRGEHGLADNFTQPCVDTGCEDFRLSPCKCAMLEPKFPTGHHPDCPCWDPQEDTEEEDPGHTPPQMWKLGACAGSPGLWRDYIHATTEEERELAV